MKKIRLLIIAGMLCMLFTACGEDNKDMNGNTTTTEVLATTEASTTTEVPTITETPTTTAKTTELPFDKPIELPFVPVG